MKVFLRSQDSDLQTGSSAIWILRRPLVFPPGTRLKVQLRKLSMYNVFRTVTTRNNTLVTSRGTYQIPVGTYDATSLSLQLSTQMQGIGVSVEFLPTRLHFLFKVNEGSLSLLRQSTMFKLLGLTDISHTSTGGVIESDTLCDLAPPAFINVRVNLLFDNIDSVSGGQGTTLLSQIPVEGSYGDLMQYFDQSSFYSDAQAGVINFFRVELTDGDDESELDMQGLPWSLVLALDIVAPESVSTLDTITNKYYESLQGITQDQQQ
jgi:hypothetical protein